MRFHEMFLRFRGRGNLAQCCGIYSRGGEINLEPYNFATQSIFNYRSTYLNLLVSTVFRPFSGGGIGVLSLYGALSVDPME